jgi:hypothetical protein
MHSIVLAVTVAMLSAADLQAQTGGRWVSLGQRQVTDRTDHDAITVSGARGTFRSIKLEVARRAVDFHRVVIHFANGGDQRVELRNTIPAGGSSREIDIDGRDRTIRSVEFWYDAKSIGRGGSATVRLMGRS